MGAQKNEPGLVTLLLAFGLGAAAGSLASLLTQRIREHGQEVNIEKILLTCDKAAQQLDQRLTSDSAASA